MMNMRKFLFLLPSILLLFTSCLSDSDKENMISYNRMCFNRVVPAGTTDATFSAVQYDYVMNYTKNTITFTVRGLNLGGENEILLDLPEVPYKQTDDGYVFSYIPNGGIVKVDGVESPDYSLENLSGTWEVYGTYLNSAEFFQVSYTIDTPNGTFYVQANMQIFGYPFNTTNVMDAAGNVVISKDNEYTLVYDAEKCRSRLVINGPKLTTSMLSGVDNWVIKDIPAEPTYNGFRFTAPADSVFKPMIHNYDVPGYEIKNISGIVFISDKKAQLSFECNGEKVNVVLQMKQDKQPEE